GAAPCPAGGQLLLGGLLQPHRREAAGLGRGRSGTHELAGYGDLVRGQRIERVWCRARSEMRGDGAAGGEPAMVERNVHRLGLGCELDDDGVGGRINVEPLAVDADPGEIVARRVDRVPFAA
ncbi:hypothetical protein E4T56_gene20561, partial [Termitomyces sp. T112]